MCDNFYFFFYILIIVLLTTRLIIIAQLWLYSTYMSVCCLVGKWCRYLTSPVSCKRVLTFCDVEQNFGPPPLGAPCWYHNATCHRPHTAVRRWAPAKCSDGRRHNVAHMSEGTEDFIVDLPGFQSSVRFTELCGGHCTCFPFWGFFMLTRCYTCKNIKPIVIPACLLLVFVSLTHLPDCMALLRLQAFIFTQRGSFFIKYNQNLM